MKPILYKTIPFDATLENEIKFSWTGNQAFKNRLRIYTNVDNMQIYDVTQTTMQLKHTVPANTLVNGTEYNCEISVFDKDGIESEFSTKIIFKCLSTPTFNFTNLSANQVVQNATFTPILTYSQAQGELLNSYNFTLYDYGQNQIYISDTKYDTDVLSDTISGLDDNSQYYLRSQGITVNGMEVDTGLIPFSVDYVQPSIFSKVGLENINGSIKINYNAIIVTGTCNVENPIYINNKEIDLTADGVKVSFEEGFSVAKDFTLQYLGRNITNRSPIFECIDGDRKLTLTYHQSLFKGETTEKVYINLKASGAVTTYTINSNMIDIPLETDILHIWVRRINNLYEVKLTNLGGV